MLNELRKHLIFLFSAATALIVSITVLLAFFMNASQVAAGNRKAFERNVDAVVKEIQANKHIKDSWLLETEIANRLVIRIWDNGHPFFYKGSWMQEAQRDAYALKIENQAAEDGIFVTKDPEYVYETRSKTYALKGEEGERFYGTAVVLPAPGRYKSLVMLGQFPGEHQEIMRIGILCIIIELLSIGALFLVSYFLVGRALAPVEINQKRQKEFIAAVSHEIRSPLAVIRTNASALLVGEADVGSFVQGIQNECTRMARLTEDMIALTISDNRSWSLKKDLLDMNLFLIELYDGYYSLSKEKHQKLILEFTEDSLPKLWADRQRLRQILSILLDNAMSYAPENTIIVMRAGRGLGAGKGCFRVEIEDHGRGIPNQEKERIFERFYRIDQSRTHKGHFGLGLSIATELALLHEGRLMVKDTEGGGATFVLELPLTS